MDPIVTSSLSYQTLLSGRRLSLASSPPSSLPASMSPGSVPVSPVDALPLRRTERMGAVDFTYNCDKCGFGTNLLSSYMPHASNPCDQPPAVTWGSL
ncbi:hypothetical protein H4R19_006793 [Coemansia spiralis]|nr:hypothetical protein H4R19_006793 [Coemansia spiralis]